MDRRNVPQGVRRNISKVNCANCGTVACVVDGLKPFLQSADKELTLSKNQLTGGRVNSAEVVPTICPRLGS